MQLKDLKRYRALNPIKLKLLEKTIGLDKLGEKKWYTGLGENDLYSWRSLFKFLLRTRMTSLAQNACCGIGTATVVQSKLIWHVSRRLTWASTIIGTVAFINSRVTGVPIPIEAESFFPVMYIKQIQLKILLVLLLQLLSLLLQLLLTFFRYWG